MERENVCMKAPAILYYHFIFMITIYVYVCEVCLVGDNLMLLVLLLLLCPLICHSLKMSISFDLIHSSYLNNKSKPSIWSRWFAISYRRIRLLQVAVTAFHWSGIFVLYYAVVLLHSRFVCVLSSHSLPFTPNEIRCKNSLITHCGILGISCTAHSHPGQATGRA